MGEHMEEYKCVDFETYMKDFLHHFYIIIRGKLNLEMTSQYKGSSDFLDIAFQRNYLFIPLGIC